MNRDKALFWVFAGSCIFAWLTFCHSDLITTARMASLLYFEPVSQFYELSKSLNDDGAAYNFTTYALFYILLLPLKLTEIITAENFRLEAHEFYLRGPWYLYLKLIPLGFFMGCACLLKRIAFLVQVPEAEREKIYFYLATSPFILFTVFIFSQYDSIAVFFALLGLFYFLTGKSLLSGVMLSLAISFKSTALLVVLPFFLLGNYENFSSTIRWFSGLVLTSFILGLPGKLIHGFSDTAKAFQGRAFYKLIHEKFVTSQGSLYILAFFIILICISMFLSQDKETPLWRRATAYGLLILGNFFIWVSWNPQWHFLLVPFLMFGFLIVPSKRRFLVLEMVLYFSFIFYTVLNWNHNVDDAMMVPWARELFEVGGLNIIEFLDKRLYYPKDVYWTLYAAILVGLIGYIWFHRRNSVKTEIVPQQTWWWRGIVGIWLFVFLVIIS